MDLINVNADLISTLWDFRTLLLFSYRLSVVSNKIEGEGLVALSQSMKTNLVLSNIYIWGNKFDEDTCVVSDFSSGLCCAPLRYL